MTFGDVIAGFLIVDSEVTVIYRNDLPLFYSKPELKQKALFSDLPRKVLT